jgi:hypothetical protein
VSKALLSFRRQQQGVAVGMGLGLMVTVLALGWRSSAVGPTDLSSRLAQWLRCDLLAGLWLLAAVARLARHRFFSPGDIDGSLGTESRRARVSQSLVQNTLEQTVLAVIAYGGWLLIPNPTLPDAQVWVAVGCFSVGRLLFFLGYERGAPFRAFGFALTFYPTVGLLAARAYYLLRAGMIAPG